MADSPNILMIMTDQQPTSTIGCYGNVRVKTPAQDSIARGGTRFENFYIAAFPCTPSRATLITGRYPHNHGVVTNDIVLSEDIPSLGNTFQNAGFDTAWIGKWHLGGQMYRGLAGQNFDNEWCYERVENKEDF